MKRSLVESSGTRPLKLESFSLEGEIVFNLMVVDGRTNVGPKFTTSGGPK